MKAINGQQIRWSFNIAEIVEKVTNDHVVKQCLSMATMKAGKKKTTNHTDDKGSKVQEGDGIYERLLTRP